MNDVVVHGGSEAAALVLGAVGREPEALPLAPNVSAFQVPVLSNSHALIAIIKNNNYSD